MTAPLLADVTEKSWQAQVVELARTLGWLPYHTFDSRRSAHGFPDLVLVRERVVWLELKREKGKLTEPQRDWLRALLATGAEAYVCRPRDLDALSLVLRAYGRIHARQWTESQMAAYCALADATDAEVAA